MYILFDIGGTKMRVAGSDDLKTFVSEPVVLETPKEYRTGIAALKEVMDRASAEAPIEGIAGGIAGSIDQERGCLTRGPNLSGWFEKPIRDDLVQTFGVPVHIENDAAVVGLGEMHHGAGSAEGIAAYLTVSTGVGGARYENGAIDTYAQSFEPGHQIIDPDKSMCPDCESGELESYIGGAATERRMGKKPYDILEPEFWETYAKYLAYGLNNTIMHWTPRLVVLGGSMIVGDPAIPVDRTEAYLKEILSAEQMPEIKKAELGDLGGLYGAMVLMSSKK